MSAESLGQLFFAQEEVRRWEAERENATARLQLARSKEARATLMSQHQPVAGLGIDRVTLGILLSYTVHCDRMRLERELKEQGAVGG